MTLTVAQALWMGTDRLRAVTETPRLEAEILLAHVTSLSRTVLLAHPEHMLGLEEREEYERLLACRATGYPLPYLTGRVEFYGLEFRVTPDVLIPRPETEVLVDRALKFRPHTVIDVGTGSGCIAIALAVHLPEAHFWATDLSSAALRVAQENARRHAVASRICFLQADLLSPLKGPVDLVVSNPPYVAEEEWTSLPVSVRHEPALALKGGENGLDVICRLLAEAPRLLRSGGTLLVEIGAAQGERVRALAQDLIPGARISLLPDLAGHDRVLEVVL